MSKKTDHAKLWRKEKEKVVKIANLYDQLRRSYQGLVDMLEDIKAGKINIKDIMTEDKEFDKNEKEVLEYLRKTNPLNKETKPVENANVSMKAETQNVVDVKKNTRQKVV